MYFRLERLFPQHREFILEAGDLDVEGQLSAYHKFLGVLIDEIASDLKQFGTAEALADAYRAGKLNACLVTKAAKQLLARTT